MQNAASIPTQLHRHAALSLALALAVVPGAHADPKRALPDYDGRGNPDQDAGHWALWIPRVALAPLYVVNEYVVRRPVGFLVKRAERERWRETVENLFTFGPKRNNLLVPTVLFDFGLLPSVGLYFAATDVFATGNDIRIHAATWGRSWVNVTAMDRVRLDGGRTELALRGEFRRALDNLFYGIGPSVTDATKSRYGFEKLDAGVSATQRLGNGAKLSLGGGVRRMSFLAGGCCDDETVAERVMDGTLPMPAGYGEAYTPIYERAQLVVDGRAPRPAPGSGGYLEAHEVMSFDTSHHRSWINYGGVIGAAVDLTGTHRIIRMQMGVDLVDPVKDDVVPFTELAAPGTDLMPGFVKGWMNGRSAFAAQVAYTWPIWMSLDAQARFAVGNAFGEHLDGLSTRRLRVSGDIGVTTVGVRDQPFEILFGVGTETFEQGADITSVRVSVGSRRGF